MPDVASTGARQRVRSSSLSWPCRPALLHGDTGTRTTLAPKANARLQGSSVGGGLRSVVEQTRRAATNAGAPKAGATCRICTPRRAALAMPGSSLLTDDRLGGSGSLASAHHENLIDIFDIDESDH